MSEEEAKRVISQYLKYPQPVFNLTHAGPAGSPDVPRFMKGIEKLQVEGYITEDASASSNKADKTYVPTGKSRGYVSGLYVRESFAVYDGAVCRIVLRRIDGIGREKDQCTTVTFTTGYEPIEPYYSLFCINDNCEYFGEKLRKEEPRTIVLKRDGKGWRAMS